jgi:hypothetical protein
MAYVTALGRLKRAMTPYLTGQPVPVEGLFETVFR